MAYSKKTTKNEIMQQGSLNACLHDFVDAPFPRMRAGAQKESYAHFKIVEEPSPVIRGLSRPLLRWHLSAHPFAEGGRIARLDVERAGTFEPADKPFSAGGGREPAGLGSLLELVGHGVCPGD